MSAADNVKLKRIYDPKSPDDGYRILVSRYWPRGVAKDAKDEYNIKLSPSRALLHEFKHDGLTWNEYVPRFLEEMRNEDASSEIRRLAKMARTQTITLMCICEDERQCHRSLLRELILQQMAS